MPYTYDELLEAYRRAGVTRGQVIYVVSELWRLREYADPAEGAVTRAHFGALRELIGPEGTLVASTGSTNICNSDTVFDLAATPSHGVGVLSEFVRLQPGAKRSFHPFVSYTAIGAQADAITRDVSRHAYGPETPEARMIEMDARLVSIGMKPNLSCSTGHHVEQMAAVPFRYVKEFTHPVRRGGEVRREPFYMHVWYRDTGMVKDRYEELFRRLGGELKISSVPLGRGTVFSYSMREFYQAAIRIVALDPYVSCKTAPQNRPYQR